MSNSQPSAKAAGGEPPIPSLAHSVDLPANRLSLALDTALDRVGFVFSWLWVAVMGAILYSVIGRYAFGQGSVMLEEMSWHLAGAAWLVGLSYTLVSDHHVRVDVFHERFSGRVKAMVEVFGLLFLLLPFLVIVFKGGIDYFWSSYLQDERSQAPAGLPARWVLKGVMAMAFGLLLVAALSRLSKCFTMLFGWPRPIVRPESG